MRIATWNVNGLRARLDLLQLWLRERSPDLVGIQEIKLVEEQLPRAAIEAAGYRAVVHGQKAWNGVAILSREEAMVTRKGLPGQEDFGARLICVESAGLSFVTIYCPNGKHTGHDDFPRKLAWLDALHDYFQRNHDPDRPVVLCGDFNICPDPLDSWNEDGLKGSIFHTDEERARFRRLLDWGFRDLFRAQRPDERAFTWWDYRAGAFPRNEGLRLDFLLATRCVTERLQSVEIDRDYRKKKDGLTPSDHAPVIAVL